MGEVDVVGHASDAAQDDGVPPISMCGLADLEEGGAEASHGAKERIPERAHDRARRRSRAQRS